MPFNKVETQVDLPAQERNVLAFWDQIQAFEKLRAKNKGKPRWSFLDGPITANNPMGVHHAWGRTYKDAYQRFFAMTGHELRYQNGFDCQGLWVEVEVEKEFALKSKRDIENLVPGDRFKSIDLFVQRCKDRVNKFARRQTEQSIRLGYWMDWDRTDADWEKSPDERKSYFTMSEENNYTIWSFLKKCHARGLVYRGYDAMPWCGRCGVGLSQMEMHEGYRLVAHRAVFVKFPLRQASGGGGQGSGEKENLLVWTTTPWTLSSNVAAAVNPALTYLKVRHKDEIYIVARGAFTAQRLEEQFKRKEWIEGVPKLKTLEQMFKEKGGYEIVSEVAGSALVGFAYDGPFDALAAQAHPAGFPQHISDVVIKQNWGPAQPAKDLHRIIAWNEVGEAEGTGIVHIAPGCGKEDFFLGKEQRLVPIAPLDESGTFVEGFGELSGRSALDPAVTNWIIANLQEKNLLFAVEKYPHSYPHCWRCKTELLFRLVDEWFIGMSWRDEIVKICGDIRWIPEFGYQRELDWLKNMGDWMISKKRYWGLALPIWVDEVTGDFEVIGSQAELKERAVEGWHEFDGHTPHRPWVDQVKIRNPKTGNLMARVPDVGNPWLDAGIVPYSTMKYNSDPDYWQKWFPADFITESFPGQFRNWFYAMLAMSAMMTGKAPFRNLLGHGLVRDEEGKEMHKTAGNSIPFEGAADEGYTLRDKTGKEKKHTQMGADLMRWMYCRNNPAANINFGPGPAEEIRSKFLMKLWNTYAFFCNYARLDAFDPSAAQVPVKDRPDIDRWILSDLQLLVQTAHHAFQNYNVMAFCLAAEEFVDDKLSNWYVRRNRRRFWKSERGSDKMAAYETLYTVLVTLTKLCAPVIPFLTETMYQNLAELGSETPSSVHLCDFPEADESLIDAQLSADMDALLRLVSLGSAARNTVTIKVRQPLAELSIQPASEVERNAVTRFPDQITEELNLKRVTLHESNAGSLLSFSIKPNPKALGPKLGPKLGQFQKALNDQNPAEVTDKLLAGKPFTIRLAGDDFSIEPGDLFIKPVTAEGLVGLADKGTLLLLDTRITPELALEGMAREVIRNVQQARKDGGLNMEDRIELYLETASPQLTAAIHNHRDYIASECLVVKWLSGSLGEGAYKVDAKIEQESLKIELRKTVFG